MKGVVQAPQSTVEASISITRDSDRSKPYNIEITGFWTIPQIQGIFGALAKANRAHVAKMKAQPKQGDGDE